MDNTEKLLRAFIKAQGYEIEEIESTEKKFAGKYAGDDIYTDTPTIDYKVTKKEEPIFMTDKEAQHLRNVQLKQMVDNMRDPHEFDECSLND